MSSGSKNSKVAAPRLAREVEDTLDGRPVRLTTECGGRRGQNRALIFARLQWRADCCSGQRQRRQCVKRSGSHCRSGGEGVRSLCTATNGSGRQTATLTHCEVVVKMAAVGGKEERERGTGEGFQTHTYRTAVTRMVVRALEPASEKRGAAGTLGAAGQLDESGQAQERVPDTRQLAGDRCSGRRETEDTRQTWEKSGGESLVCVQVFTILADE